MPTVVVAAGVVRDGRRRILLTRRMDGAHLAGLWEFPGGKLEAGESPEACVARECREECGIEVEVREVLDVTFHRYEKKDVLLLFYDCALTNGTVEHLGVAEHVWVTAPELDAFRLPPPDAKLVAKLKKSG